MAKARALDKRRKSIRSIRKITRTMELISTAGYRKAFDRSVAAAAYTKRISKLVQHLAHAGLEVSHPLLEQREATDNARLLVIGANRGMCGGYNGHIYRLGAKVYGELNAKYENVEVEVSGKRIASAFRFRKVPFEASYEHFDVNPMYNDVNTLAERYLESYLAGSIDRLDVVYTKYLTASRQEAICETLLPMGMPNEDDGEETTGSSHIDYEMLPSPESILEEVVPTSFKMQLFQSFLDAALSEQIARMVAMKSATENADKMISELSMTYNRARQGQITGELLEIVAGADAIQ